MRESVELETTTPLLTSDSFAVDLRRSASNSTSQVAIVGYKLSPIESLDYELVENELFKQDWRAQGRAHILQYVILKWSLCFLVGALAGGAGFLTNIAVENIAGVKFVVTSNLMLAQKYGGAFVVFCASNFMLTMFAASITVFVAPEAAGSGIPEIKAYLNGVDAPGIFSFRTLLVKVVGSIAAVSSSLHVGKAGPLVHTGACLASLLGRLRPFRNDRDRRDLLTCGAAAGVAAAFRAPVGGVLFALEALSSWWRSAVLWRSFFTTAVTAVILRALIDICKRGSCGLFGKGGLIMYDVSKDDVAYRVTDLPPVILLGVGGGVLGSLYNYLLDKLLRVYNLINEKGRFYKLLLAASLSLFTSFSLFFLPFLASCKPCPAAPTETCPSIGRSGNFKKFQCPPNHYNDLASLFFNTNDDTIRNLYSAGTDRVFTKSSMLVFFVSSYALGILSYGIAAPSGLFVPVILTGASYGRFVAILMRNYLKLDHGLFAILGSAALLGGSMRITVSVCVILLELTNNLLLLPLIMLVLLISKTVADGFNANIYDIIVKLKGFPYLEAHAEPYMRQLTVGDVVMGPLRVFNGIEKVGNLVHALRTCGHNGFPVLEEPEFGIPVLYGLVLRAHLIVLLRKKEFFVPSSGNSVFDASKQFCADDFAKRGCLTECETIDDINLTGEELEMFVDLRPFTNTSPYTVVETMSLAKALVLFREVGLRHLLVIPKSTSRAPVVGILTRHDFMAEHILGLHPFLLRNRWKRLRLGKFDLTKYFGGFN